MEVRRCRNKIGIILKVWAPWVPLSLVQLTWRNLPQREHSPGPWRLNPSQNWGQTNAECPVVTRPIHGRLSDCLCFFHFLYVSTVNERGSSPVFLWRSSDLALSSGGWSLVRVEITAGFLSSFLLSRPYLSFCYVNLLFGDCSCPAQVPIQVNSEEISST